MLTFIKRNTRSCCNNSIKNNHGQIYLNTCSFFFFFLMTILGSAVLSDGIQFTIIAAGIQFTIAAGSRL